jgi:hypothetical protein
MKQCRLTHSCVYHGVCRTTPHIPPPSDYIRHERMAPTSIEFRAPAPLFLALLRTFTPVSSVCGQLSLPCRLWFASSVRVQPPLIVNRLMSARLSPKGREAVLWSMQAEACTRVTLSAVENVSRRNGTLRVRSCRSFLRSALNSSLRFDDHQLTLVHFCFASVSSPSLFSPFPFSVRSFPPSHRRQAICVSGRLWPHTHVDELAKESRSALSQAKRAADRCIPSHRIRHKH